MEKNNWFCASWGEPWYLKVASSSLQPSSWDVILQIMSMSHFYINKMLQYFSLCVIVLCFCGCFWLVLSFKLYFINITMFNLLYVQCLGNFNPRATDKPNKQMEGIGPLITVAQGKRDGRIGTRLLCRCSKEASWPTREVRLCLTYSSNLCGKSWRHGLPTSLQSPWVWVDLSPFTCSLFSPFPSDESNLKMNEVEHVPQSLASHTGSYLWNEQRSEHGADMLKPDPRDIFFLSKWSWHLLVIRTPVVFSAGELPAVS